MPIVYEAVNAIQDTAWKVNKDVLNVLNEMANFSNPLANIPSSEKENSQNILKVWMKTRPS